MRKALLIRGARQLLTLRGPNGPRRGADLRKLGIIQDGAVLIADGLIAEVGPSRRVENLALARGAEEIDASGCVVMPGFVDSHVHVVKGTPLELSPRALKALALRAVDEAVRHGTTAMEAEARELKILRVHAALRELPMTFVSTFVAAGLPLEAADRLLPIVRRRNLAEFAEIGCDDAAILARARQLGWRVKLRAGAAPHAIATAVEIGATGVSDVGAVTERDAVLLAQSETIATLSPAVKFDRGAECYPPARMLIDRGAAIALGSGVNPPNMQMTVALACHAMNMTAAEAIAASTINGAHALGRAANVGSIEAGKSADVAILGVPDYRELPYHLGVNLVNLVLIQGVVRVERPEVKWPAR
jgi:imidazolonepropionase